MTSIFDTYLLQNIQKIGEEGTTTKNYDRFYGKKITSCVFTLDSKEPYYIYWGNLIGDNIHIIKNTIYLNVMEKYKLDNHMVQYFYSYWRLYCPDEERKPSNFIKFLKERMNDQKSKLITYKMPNYIDEMLSNIEFELNNCKKKTEKEGILIKYDDSEYFLEKIETRLDASLMRYLGIDDDESDDE
jgi:hypothetical protein